MSARLPLAMALALLGAPALAQRFTATIRGNVTDPSEAVIAGAKVTLRNEATGVTRTAVTNDAGNYSFPDVLVGSYQVEIRFTALKPVVRTGILVSVADVREVNVRLATAELKEVVEASAAGPSVKTVGAEVAGLASGEEVRALPLNGRNFMQITLLQPGVTPQEGLNTVNKGLLGGADI